MQTLCYILTTLPMPRCSWMVNSYRHNAYFLALLWLLSLSGCSLVGSHGLFSYGSSLSDDARQALQDSEGYSDLEFRVHSLPTQRLPKPPLMRNAEVEREIRDYLRGDARTIREGLARKDVYEPVLSKIFEDEGVPAELLNLALIESGFDTHAKSGAGAVGIWQFMKSTAKLYGLAVGILKDQRRDPVLSTIAAARHLRDLYSIYRDWYLALAAYNAGPGAVDRAIRKSGEANFWTLARRGHLSSQTREFVPRFIAATLIASEPERYGIGITKPETLEERS